MSKFLYWMAALHVIGALINLPFIDHPISLIVVLVNLPLAVMNYFFAKDAKKSEARWGA